MADRSYFLALVVALSILLGFAVGQYHPGKTLVPVRDGTPRDLPVWACNELVTLRVQNAQLNEWLITDQRPPLFIHYRVASPRSCG